MGRDDSHSEGERRGSQTAAPDASLAEPLPDGAGDAARRDETLRRMLVTRRPDKAQADTSSRSRAHKITHGAQD